MYIEWLNADIYLPHITFFIKLHQIKLITDAICVSETRIIAIKYL